MLTLLIPDKPDPERARVAACVREQGGEVMRLGRFWDPPALEAASTRVYGPDTFCLVLREKLGLTLHRPADDLLLHAPRALLGRTVRGVQLSDMEAQTYPLFAKSLIPKLVEARVYQDVDEVRAASRDLEKPRR